MSSDLLFDALQQIDPDNQFGDEDEIDERIAALEKDEEEQKRAEKRNRRLGDCGKFANWYNPHTGKPAGFVFKCGLFRQCEICLNRRAENERDWLGKASIDKELVAQYIDHAEVTRILRKAELGKEEYLRYPQEDGRDLLILDKPLDDVAGEAVDYAWVMQQDWSTIAHTPEGRNRSGTLHVPVSDEEPDEFTIINTQQFVTSADYDETARAMRAAVEITSTLNPQTPDEVADALYRRISVATGQLRTAGHVVNVYSKKLKLVHALIDWQSDSSDSAVSRQIKHVYTKNPTRDEMPLGADLERASVKSRETVPIPALA